jgi:creatinine amidohydrolase
VCTISTKNINSKRCKVDKLVRLPDFREMSVSIYRMTHGEFCDVINNVKRAIIPVGSIEQHGEHLPVSTDSLIAENIARLVAEQIPCFVVPPISFGVSYEHRPMFNISIRNASLSRIICDICCSLVENGIKNIVLINGHHGNVGALQYIAQNLYGKIPNDISIHSINYWHLMQSEFDHAGDIETSLVLAIAPELVRMDKAEANYNNLSKSKVAYASMTNNPNSFPKITGNGVWGDPRNATADKGHQLLDEIVRNLVQTIHEIESY